MRMYNLKPMISGATWFASNLLCFAQPFFVNLDFESPILPLVPDLEFQVPIGNALPGWNGFIGGSLVDRVVYNTVSLGAAAISFHGPGSREIILHGRYEVILQASFPNAEVTAAIAQTGIIPSSAQSVRFYGNGAYSVTFAGQTVPLVVLSGSQGTNYVFGGDISPFAGLTGELRLQGSGKLDYIQFSTEAVPEPGTVGLLVLGGGLLCFHRWRPNRC